MVDVNSLFVGGRTLLNPFDTFFTLCLFHVMSCHFTPQISNFLWRSTLEETALVRVLKPIR